MLSLFQGRSYLGNTWDHSAVGVWVPGLPPTASPYYWKASASFAVKWELHSQERCEGEISGVVRKEWPSRGFEWDHTWGSLTLPFFLSHLYICAGECTARENGWEKKSSFETVTCWSDPPLWVQIKHYPSSRSCLIPSIKKNPSRGAWLAQSFKHVTLDHRVMSSSSTLDVEIT